MSPVSGRAAWLTWSSDQGRRAGDLGLHEARAKTFIENALIKIVDSRSGADIREMSFFHRESEVLFRPGTRFVVESREWNDLERRWDLVLREDA